MEMSKPITSGVIEAIFIPTDMKEIDISNLDREEKFVLFNKFAKYDESDVSFNNEFAHLSTKLTVIWGVWEEIEYEQIKS